MLYGRLVTLLGGRVTFGCVHGPTVVRLTGIDRSSWLVVRVTEPPIAYSAVSMALRPPRAVVVFNGGDNWTYWVRRAHYLAGQVWGGCGFALVPHRNGRVDPILLQACRAYDPDYVVVCPLTVGELEQLRPGWFKVDGGDGHVLAGPERDRLFEESKDQTVPVADDMAARDLIAEVCSPYRTRLDADSWDEDVQFLEPGGRGFHDALSVEGIFPGSDLVLSGKALSVLACPRSWGGVLGALTASSAGVVEVPDSAAGEPDLSDPVRAQLTSWLLSVSSKAAPEELLWTPTEGSTVALDPTPVAHIRSMAGLVTVTSAARRRTGLLVLGDEPEDFALARLWQLTFGFGRWLPSILGTDQDDPPWQLTHSAAEMAYRHGQEASKLMLTSVSRPKEQVARVHERLLRDAGGMGDSGREATAVVAAADLGWKQQWSTHLGVAEQFDSYLTVPTVVDETGTRSMAAPLPAPIVNTRHLLRSSELTWHVDIGWRPNQMVRGRGLDGQEVFTADTPFRLTWGRSSRNGISYESHRFDFVVSGIPEVNKLARPAVRDLSLTAWIEAKGREHDFATRPSPAGHRTNQLTRMLGGRRPFVDLFSGPLLPALQDLLPTSSTTSEAYPNHDGVALGAGEGVLSLAGFNSRVPGLDVDQLRGQLDVMLRAGVLRRGLVLQCETCEEVQFQSVDKIGQTWICARCDASGDLSRAAWKMPNDEPVWFYDLHPVARHFLRDHGDVSALLSAYLAAHRADDNAIFHDVSELEFMVKGQPKVEVDLISYVEDTLTVAECKSNDHLATDKTKARDEVNKKCQVAAWLHADQLVFATTASTWTNSTPGVIRSAITAFPWGPLGSPDTYLITGLGTATPITQALPSS